MKQLQVNHIAPYFPYGLKTYCISTKAIGKLDYLSLKTYGVLIDHGLGDGEDSEEVYFGVKNKNTLDFKALLVPIDKVPNWDEIILAGLNNAVPKLPLNEIVGMEFEYHDRAVECMVWDSGLKYQITYSYDERAFTIDGGLRFNQLAAFNELFKNQIDVNLLINEGLALDKTQQ